MKMKEGRSPQQACEEALRMITGRYKKVNPDFFPAEKFVAISKNGELGCATMKGKAIPQMSVYNETGFSKYNGTIAFPAK
jgi:hypothetical protein